MNKTEIDKNPSFILQNGNIQEDSTHFVNSTFEIDLKWS